MTQVTVQRVDEEEFTVRLGSMEILEDEDGEVDLIDWLTESASATIVAKVRTRGPVMISTCILMAFDVGLFVVRCGLLD